MGGSDGDGDALLPRPARGPARWVAAGGLVVGPVLGVAVSTSPVDRADHRVDAWVVSSASGVADLLRPVADLSGPAVLVTCCLFLAALCLAVRRPAGALLAVAAPALASALSDLVLKPVVARQAPAGGYGYPSGHATAAAAVAAVLVLLVVPGGALGGRTSPRTRALVRVLAGAATAYVALGLVALHYHTTADVLGGVAVGAGTVCALALLLDRAARAV